MKTFNFRVIFFSLMVSSLMPFDNVFAETPSEVAAENPVIWADVPDMSIIRVGDTWYMSSTTMHLSPGLPIMKSKNLVDWDIVSYAYDVLENTDGLSLRNGKSEYGAGSWASSLRYNNGVFYVSTFAGSTGKTHIYYTSDIENKPWQEIKFSPALHDHSLFFDDDGKVYMLYGATDLRLTELKDDLTGIKPGGFNEIIIKGVGRISHPEKAWGEGSQLFKIDGKYYLCNITWPDMRTQLIHRADKISGPYEGRVILHDRGIAQGGLIDTPDGHWYAYLFQDCGAVGRVPFLVPFTWKDGWPVLGNDGKVPMTLSINHERKGLGNLVVSDNFERSENLLRNLKDARKSNQYIRDAFPPAWQWNHNPDNNFWSLTDRPGWLRLSTERIDGNLPEARNSLTQRTFGPKCAATTLIDTSAMKDGDYAGLAALQKQYGFVGVKMENGKKAMVMVANDKKNNVVEEELVDIKTDTVHLRIECDFKDLKDEAKFFWSEDGKNWQEIGRPLKMVYTLPHFMGYRFALFYYATQNPGGHVDFDYCTVTD
ncbi:MAG: glycoside hydrolase family 43 protein [Thermoguttaceae bacterium]